MHYQQMFTSRSSMCRQLDLLSYSVSYHVLQMLNGTAWAHSHSCGVQGVCTVALYIELAARVLPSSCQQRHSLMQKPSMEVLVGV